MKKTAKIIVITGTPGVGKSTLARFLAHHFSWRRVDLHHHYQQLSSSYDQKKRCFILDFSKVKKLIIQKRDEESTPLIIDSHIAHQLPKKIVDLCVVLTYSDLKTLHKRLQKRRYSKAKVTENIQAEIFQVCLEEAKENGHKIIIFDRMNQKNLASRAKEIKKALKS